MTRRSSVIGLAVAWTTLALLLAALLWRTWQGPDIFYHLSLARDVLALHTPDPPDRLLMAQPQYHNIYWLFQLLVYGTWKVGSVLAVTLLFGGLWFAALALWLRTTELWRRPAVGLPVALATILVVQTRFDPRPEVVSYLLLVLQIGWLACWRWDDEHDRGRRPILGRLAAFALTTALWANVHAYVVLGVLVVGARFVAAIVGRESTRAVRALGSLLLVTIAATLASPLGIQVWLLIARWWTFQRSLGPQIGEFAPPTGALLQQGTTIVFWGLWGVTAAAVAVLILRRRTRVFPVLLAAAGLYLSAAAIRNLPLLPILSAPLWRDALALLPQDTAQPRARAGVIAGTALASTILVIWVVGGGFYRSLRTGTTFGIGLQPAAFPLQMTTYLDRHGAQVRLFDSAADGGYLALRFPQMTLYADSRYIEAAPVREYFAAFVKPDVFRTIDHRCHFDAALLKVVDSGPLVLALLADPDWRLVTGDPHRILFARRGAPAVEAWPSEPIVFYAGDDLSQRVNGLAAIQWTAILAQARDGARLREALTAFAAAPVVPSFVVQYGLQYGLQYRDADVYACARELAPRMLALRPEDRLAVMRLLQRAQAGP